MIFKYLSGAFRASGIIFTNSLEIQKLTGGLTMVLSTNLHGPFPVEEISNGTIGLIWNKTYFQKIMLDSETHTVTLRCMKANPENGYGEGVIVIVPFGTTVILDSNKR